MWLVNNLMLAAQPEGMDAMLSMGAIITAVKAFGASVVYSLLGLVMFGLAYKVLGVILPFSIRKELEEDQNTAVGIVLGCMMLGLSIIIAAAIHG
jgi:putative membrane protein